MNFDDIRFDEKEHRYFYGSQELVSTTSFIGRLKAPFDKAFISLRSALKELYPDRVKPIMDVLPAKDYNTLAKMLKVMGMWNPELLVKAELIRQKWDAKGRAAAERGTKIHADLEHFHKFGTVPEDVSDEASTYIDWFTSLDTPPTVIAVEQIMGDDEWGIAGMSDLITKKQTVRVNDHKSNESISTTNWWKDYYLPPFDHLLVCDLHTYSIQTSVYRCLWERHKDEETGPSTLIHLPGNSEMNFIECLDFREIIYDFFNDQQQRPARSVF